MKLTQVVIEAVKFVLGTFLIIAFLFAMLLVGDHYRYENRVVPTQYAGHVR